METMQATYGYARVSSQDQNLDRQMSALTEYGIRACNIFADKASGKDFARPAYQRLRRKLRPGDVMVVKSIDRLGRNYEEILEEWRSMTKTGGVSIVVLDMPLLNTSEVPDNVTRALITDIVLQLLSYTAQVERENIRRRQAEGIAAAKARGVRFGRPCKRRPDAWNEVLQAYWANEITRNQAAQQLGISASTFDRWRKEDAGA